jgi:hypothetical protein
MRHKKAAPTREPTFLDRIHRGDFKSKVPHPGAEPSRPHANPKTSTEYLAAAEKMKQFEESYARWRESFCAYFEAQLAMETKFVEGAAQTLGVPPAFILAILEVKKRGAMLGIQQANYGNRRIDDDEDEALSKRAKEAVFDLSDTDTLVELFDECTTIAAAPLRLDLDP